MVRRLLLFAALALLLGLGIGAGSRLAGRLSRPKLPEAAAVAAQIREVARLETLDVSLYRKVSFSPEPQPADSLWGELIAWARYTLRPPEGRAILFADAHLGIDLEQLGPESVRVWGGTVLVRLPPVRVTVELRPGETEVVGSNLDTAQSAQLFQLGKDAFEREVKADEKLKARARASAERAIRALLLTLGFTEVRFVEEFPAANQG